MKQKKITRREALFAIATISAGSLIQPSSLFCSPAKDRLRFAVIGDWGTGDRNQVEIADRMFLSHQSAPFDFVISAGDNIYPNGSGGNFVKHFETPFASLLKERISFHTVLGNHDIHLLKSAFNLSSPRKMKLFSSLLAAEDSAPLLDWLRHRPLIHIEKPYVLVHAGLLPQWTVEEAELYGREIEEVLRGPKTGELLTRLNRKKMCVWDDRMTGMSSWFRRKDLP